MAAIVEGTIDIANAVASYSRVRYKGGKPGQVMMDQGAVLVGAQQLGVEEVFKSLSCVFTTAMPLGMHRPGVVCAAAGDATIAAATEAIHATQRGEFEAVVAAWLNRSLKLEHVFHASATATTAIGLRRAMDHVGMNAVIHAVMVLKNVEEQQQFAHEQGASERLEFVSGYDFGGYAKSDAVLASFMEVVRTQNNGIPIDFVYTGKALFALNEWLLSGIDSGVLRSDAAGIYPVVFLHTGGVLQMNG